VSVGSSNAGGRWIASAVRGTRLRGRGRDGRPERGRATGADAPIRPPASEWAKKRPDARQRHDYELEEWFAEIQYRAEIRMGELSQDLETAQGNQSDVQVPPSWKNPWLAIPARGKRRRRP
jgi:hypothetical protein